MKTIGLVGGVASGKSAVANALARRGAVVFNADTIAHGVIDEPAIRERLASRWGSGVFNSDGSVNRKAVAARVFADTPAGLAERRFLEEVLHPRVRQRIETVASQLAPDTPAIVIDAPLLVEVGWHEQCDAVIFVDVPRAVRLARAVASRGWSAEEFSRREAAQMPIEDKRRFCTHVVDNSGSLAELDAQVERLWSEAVGK